MNLPEIKPHEEQAIDLVVNVLNTAKCKISRQNLFELAQTRDELDSKFNVGLKSLKSPLAVTAEALIAEIIEKNWKLTPTFMYYLKHIDNSQDECSTYYYIEAVFSQPTVKYPIPQATASVYFRIEDTHIDPPEIRGSPMMYFRIEGQHTDHDIRQVLLSVDRILAIIKIKIDFFKRLETIGLF